MNKSYIGRNSDPLNAFQPFTGQESFGYFGTFDNEFDPNLFGFPYDERPYQEDLAYGFDFINNEASSPLLVPSQETFSDYPVEENNFNLFSQSSRQTSRDLSDNSALATAQSAFTAPSDIEQYGGLTHPQLPEAAPLLPVFEDASSALPRDATSDKADSAKDDIPPAKSGFTCPQCHKAFPKGSILR